jgi:CRP/FNR family cyclic AMP-dependent transcriptional regulator
MSGQRGDGGDGRAPAFGRVDTEVEMVCVLEEDPTLGRYLHPSALKLASSAAVAPVLSLGKGTTSFLIAEPETHTHLGLLVLDGLIVRHLLIGQIGASEFYAPGDLVRPWAHRTDDAESVKTSWELLAPTRLAALDQDFANRVRAWPEFAAALLDRVTERSDSQVLQAALHQAKRVEDRVLLALWHFAGRWGQISPEGRIVNLSNISGEVLGRFVGARRQSVSTALGQLADSGAVRRRGDGSLVLSHEPPELTNVAPGRSTTHRDTSRSQRA